jgi:hypothetical protein
MSEIRGDVPITPRGGGYSVNQQDRRAIDGTDVEITHLARIDQQRILVSPVVIDGFRAQRDASRWRK